MWLVIGQNNLGESQITVFLKQPEVSQRVLGVVGKIFFAIASDG